MSYQKKFVSLFCAFISLLSLPLQASDDHRTPLNVDDLLAEISPLPPLVPPTTKRPMLRDITDQFVTAAPQPKQVVQTYAHESEDDFNDYKEYLPFPTLHSWLAKIDTLRKNRHIANPLQDKAFSSQADWDELEMLLNIWFRIQTVGPLSSNKKWLNETMPREDFFDYSQPVNSFQPFAQKIIVPEGSALIMRGDLHGDIASLSEQLKSLYEEGIINDEFKIIKPNHWIIFLGDYVDRGNYGCEVIYTILRLMIKNPDHVIAVRGNHEEIVINRRDGFKKEIFAKFRKLGNTTCEQIYNNISRIYDFLPVALYVGCHEDADVVNYAQCCHGGLEVGYNPQPFLSSNATYQIINELPTRTNLLKTLQNYQDDLRATLSHPDIQDTIPTLPQNLGFLWNDFDVNNTNQVAYNDIRNTGLIYGKDATQDILKQQSSDTHKVLWIFRGHQHSTNPLDPMMQGLVISKGVFKLWKPYETTPERSLKDGLVWTFNVGADTDYGQAIDFDFDTYAIITPQKNPANWTMKVFNQPIFKPRQVVSRLSFSSSSTDEENNALRESANPVEPTNHEPNSSFQPLRRTDSGVFEYWGNFPLEDGDNEDDQQPLEPI